MNTTAQTRVYTPDLQGVAQKMSDAAAEDRDQFMFHTADMLSAVAMWHSADESGDFCSSCWDAAEQSQAHWPCSTYQSGMTLALQWLMRRPAGDA